MSSVKTGCQSNFCESNVTVISREIGIFSANELDNSANHGGNLLNNLMFFDNLKNGRIAIKCYV